MPFNRIIALSLLLVCLVAAVIGGLRNPESTSPTVAITQEGPNLFQTRGNRIVSLTLQGGISFDGGGFDPTGAIAIRNRLRDLIDDNSVRGVLLTINSPGGTVGTSQELYRAISSLRDIKPIVVSIGDIAASGGYYAASAADVIVANPGSLTGSIGVIIQGLSFAELLDNIGVNPQTLKTGPFKDILSPTRDLTDTERDLLQALIDDSYEQFIEDVAVGRQHVPDKATDVLGEAGVAKRTAMTVAAVRELADGQVYTGRQALNLGLVDQLGGYEEALAVLRELIGDPDIPVDSGRAEVENFVLRFLQSQVSGFTQELRALTSPVLNSRLPSAL